MAQQDRFDGTEPDPVGAGDKVNVHFCNPALAGKTILVTLSNGDGASTTLAIVLGADGCGVSSWTVPSSNWDQVLLSHETSQDHTVAVYHGEAEA